MAGGERPREKGLNLEAHPVLRVVEAGLPGRRVRLQPMRTDDDQAQRDLVERAADIVRERLSLFEGTRVAKNGLRAECVPQAFIEPIHRIIGITSPITDKNRGTGGGGCAGLRGRIGRWPRHARGN